MFNLRHAAFGVAFTAAAGLAGTAAWAVPVDVELQLLVDVSGSVDATEFNLQLQGYVDAFNSPSIHSAITDMSDGRLGSIAAQMIYWSSTSRQSVAVDWTFIDSAGASQNFANAIAATVRPFSGLTAIGSAIAFGAPLFTDNGFEGTSLVIDVSGDGASNAGVNTATARDAALAGAGGFDAVTRINGIVIGGDFGLLNFYTDNVIGGTDAFVLAAATFEDFAAAVATKLEAEIRGETPGEVIPLPAAAWMLLAGIGGIGALRLRRRA